MLLSFLSGAAGMHLLLYSLTINWGVLNWVPIEDCCSSVWSEGDPDYVMTLEEFLAGQRSRYLEFVDTKNFDQQWLNGLFMVTGTLSSVDYEQRERFKTHERRRGDLLYRHFSSYFVEVRAAKGAGGVRCWLDRDQKPTLAPGQSVNLLFINDDWVIYRNWVQPNLCRLVY